MDKTTESSQTLPEDRQIDLPIFDEDNEPARPTLQMKDAVAPKDNPAEVATNTVPVGAKTNRWPVLGVLQGLIPGTKKPSLDAEKAQVPSPLLTPGHDQVKQPETSASPEQLNRALDQIADKINRELKTPFNPIDTVNLQKQLSQVEVAHLLTYPLKSVENVQGHHEGVTDPNANLEQSKIDKRIKLIANRIKLIDENQIPYQENARNLSEDFFTSDYEGGIAQTKILYQENAAGIKSIMRDKDNLGADDPAHLEVFETMTLDEQKYFYNLATLIKLYFFPSEFPELSLTGFIDGDTLSSAQIKAIDAVDLRTTPGQVKFITKLIRVEPAPKAAHFLRTPRRPPAKTARITRNH